MRHVLILCSMIATILGCPSNLGSVEPPTDRPYYPSALLQDKNTLYVFSSNFDRRYLHGSVLSIDLEKISQGLAESKTEFGSEVVTSSGFIPSFADGPVLSPNKDQILFLSREDSSLRAIGLANGKVNCQDCFSNSTVANLG